MADEENEGRAPGTGVAIGTLRGPQTQSSQKSAAGAGPGGGTGGGKSKDRVDTSVKRINEGLRSHDETRSQKVRPSTPAPDGRAARSSPPSAGSSRPSQSPQPSLGRGKPEAKPNEELDLVNAQVRAAESEVESARARAEAVRLQLDSAKGRNDLVEEQIEAARGQVEAAQAQAHAAEAQHEAATVQAEAAIAQAEVCKEQHESLKTHVAVIRAQAATVEAQGESLRAQVALMQAQTGTLEEQLGTLRRLARGTSWLAVLAAVAAVSVAALAGLAIYGFLYPPRGAPVQAAADRIDEGGAAAADTATAPGAEQADLGSQLAPLQAEQQRTSEAVADVAGRLGQVAARLAEGAGASAVATTDRVTLRSPPLEVPEADRTWNAPALQAWLKAPAGQGPGGGRDIYELGGAVRRPVKRDARVTVDVFEGQWWPAGGALDVAANGSFIGSIQIDPAAPPSRLKITLWEMGVPASREYAIASTVAPAEAPAAPVADAAPAAAAPPATKAARARAARAAAAEPAAPAAPAGENAP
jgi:chemotaxis protein histidine kinase CheA